ncbi:MAG: TIGR03619 family F420-dependent LLM class oxidoreductase [Candidatus Binatia bacterium]
MRFSLAESMCDPSHYLPLAIAAEEAGFDSYVIPDSICYPKASDTKYPYTEDGERQFLEGRPFIEPFTLIAAMGAVTKRLRFVTFVVKLPIRQPVLVAKSATSVAVMTNNRFGFGIGLSPWPEDFQVCGQEWKTRGKRMDEMIEIIRGLSTGDFFEYHGTHYDIPAIKLCPAPTRPIPMLIGGQSEPALRRAARLGDGWMQAGRDPFEPMIERLTELRKEYGREREPFEIHVISFEGFSIDDVHRLEDLGVTDVIVGLRYIYDRSTDSMPLAEKIDALRTYADEVIAKV